MKVALIWAMADNRVIGRNNQLPWYLPEDLKFFKRTTMGKPVIMGRKTFDSIGRALPGRLNIVVSRQNEYQPAGVSVVASLEQAIALASAQALVDGVDEVIVMGGAQIYELALPLADRLYITQVHGSVEGDAYFPEFDINQYQLSESQDFPAHGAAPFPYSFYTYERLN